ncbi:acetyltransferase GNAT family [Penicillium maclennaniae]|uniref:acetyltransferase GNAT family n=1 Tax=Penicillium maclennaniae TaxID=1343394 RepID=UPI002540CB39|nr:acetyltransferase GNAT family [Penicillium maclennaniae]KAJ5683722.1 acetyltransferase GNAT family [Penicillium maclennaniae]
MTIHYNQLTKEPYLKLPAPRSNVIITPHRLGNIDENADALANILNDSRVYPCLERTPYPYLHEHGVGWIEAHCKQNKEALSTLRKHLGQREIINTESADGRKFFDSCLFTCIREVLAEDPETGAPLEDRLIGDMKMERYTFYEHLYGSEERSKAQHKNEELPTGDENIIWTLGDFLASSHHGKGIMTLAIRTLIHDWGIPHMNVHHIKCYAFVGNEGSLRVLEKNGFERERTLEDWVPVSESRGGGRKSIVLMAWRGA